MKTKIPTRLLETDFSIVSLDPLIGVLHLTTEKGQSDIAINRAAAGDLAAILVGFLSAEEMPEENAANDDDPTH